VKEDRVWVMYVYFDKGSGVPDWPDIHEAEEDGEGPLVEFMKLPLWKPRGRAVFKWAVDYVTCNDERFIVFGPYKTIKAAKKAYADLESRCNLLRGYKLVPEHCISKFPHDMWTDG
jgi:hypothetical protein